MQHNEKVPSAALLDMTGVLPNGSLPSLVRKKVALCVLRSGARASFGSGSNLEKRRIISEFAADLSTTAPYFSARYACKWSHSKLLQAAHPHGNLVALIPFPALQSWH
jgi:hypothetical protein